jgi:hypothetical protein
MVLCGPEQTDIEEQLGDLVGRYCALLLILR